MATLLRKPEQRTVPAKARVAIIDIGSNSVRLVVYDGAARLPAVLFNEKVMAGLGRSLSDTGAIDKAGLARARAALARFAALAREMQVSELRTVATAAVRDAANGAAFLERVIDYAHGFTPPKKAALAIGRIKRAVQTGLEVGFEQALALERELQAELFASDDAREGLAAYTEKRKPVFQGK